MGIWRRSLDSFSENQYLEIYVLENAGLFLKVSVLHEKVHKSHFLSLKVNLNSPACLSFTVANPELMQAPLDLP